MVLFLEVAQLEGVDRHAQLFPGGRVLARRVERAPQSEQAAAEGLGSARFGVAASLVSAVFVSAETVLQVFLQGLGLEALEQLLELQDAVVEVSDHLGDAGEEVLGFDLAGLLQLLLLLDVLLHAVEQVQVEGLQRQQLVVAGRGGHDGLQDLLELLEDRPELPLLAAVQVRVLLLEVRGHPAVLLDLRL